MCYVTNENEYFLDGFYPTGVRNGGGGRAGDAAADDDDNGRSGDGFVPMGALVKVTAQSSYE